MFGQAMARIAGRFGRAESRAAARAYLLGLLSSVERKNCWQLAEQAGLARPGPMQRLLRYARWDADAVREHRHAVGIPEKVQFATKYMRPNSGEAALRVVP